VKTITHRHVMRAVSGIKTTDGSGNISQSFYLQPASSDEWDELVALYDSYRVDKAVVNVVNNTSTSYGGFFLIGAEFSDEAAPTISYTSISDALENADNCRIVQTGDKGRQPRVVVNNPNKEFHQLDSTTLDEGAYPQTLVCFLEGGYLPASSNIAYVYVDFHVTVKGHSMS